MKGAWIKKFGSEGSGTNQLQIPAGVAVDVQGNIYVSEYGNHRVQIFSSAGQSIKIIGSKGNADGLFLSPWGITIDRNGLIVVADYGNHRVQVKITSTSFRSTRNF